MHSQTLTTWQIKPIQAAHTENPNSYHATSNHIMSHQENIGKRFKPVWEHSNTLAHSKPYTHNPLGWCQVHVKSKPWPRQFVLIPAGIAHKWPHWQIILFFYILIDTLWCLFTSFQSLISLECVVGPIKVPWVPWVPWREGDCPHALTQGVEK